MQLTLRGNCNRLNSKAQSEGISGIRGVNTDSLRAHPTNRVATVFYGVMLLADYSHIDIGRSLEVR